MLLDDFDLGLTDRAGLFAASAATSAVVLDGRPRLVETFRAARSVALVCRSIYSINYKS